MNAIVSAARVMRTLGVVGAVALTGGCATIVDHPWEAINVITYPPGASCSFHRSGEIIGTIESSPGAVEVTRRAAAMAVLCTKDGYRPAAILERSHFTGTTFSNLLIGWIPGAVVDLSTGADFAYPELVTMTLIRNVPGTIPPPPPYIVRRPAAPSSGPTTPSGGSPVPLGQQVVPPLTPIGAETLPPVVSPSR